MAPRLVPASGGVDFCFDGDEDAAADQEGRAARHEDWSEFQRQADLCLRPAACYQVYPAIAARGRLPANGICVDPGRAWVFRREPSDDPARLQMFEQHELVRLGEPEAVVEWRGLWCERSLELLHSLGLKAELDGLGFGLERVALALLRRHGLDPGHWPGSVGPALGL